MSTSEDGLVTDAQPVIDLIRGNGFKDMVYLQVRGTNGTAEVPATAGHLFMLASGAWIAASKMTPGMTLFNPVRERVVVLSTRAVRERHEVFNLTVANFHTYYLVAGGPLLVHNCNRAIVRWSTHALERLEKFHLSSGQVEQAFRLGRHTGPGKHPGSVRHVLGNVWAVVDRRGCVISCGKVRWS
jgi:hypothetical protein